MSELFDAFWSLKEAMETIDAEPERHPPALVAFQRAQYEAVREQVLTQWYGGIGGPGIKAPFVQSGKLWMICGQKQRHSLKYHLADKESAAVTVCGLAAENVHAPEGDATLSVLCDRYEICIACRDVARMRMGKYG